MPFKTITVNLCLAIYQFSLFWTTQTTFFCSHLVFMLIIMINKQIILDDLNQMSLNRALSSTGGVKDGTLTSRAVTLVHPYGLFGNKL